MPGHVLFFLASVCWQIQAAMQVSIILGSTGQSYLVGFGSNFPQHVFQVRCVCLKSSHGLLPDGQLTALIASRKTRSTRT